MREISKSFKNNTRIINMTVRPHSQKKKNFHNNIKLTRVLET